MKKAVVILSLMLIAILVAGGFIFFLRQPPKPVFYAFKQETQLRCNIAGSKKVVLLTPYVKVLGTGRDQFLEDHRSVICNAVLFTVKTKTEEQLSDTLFVEALTDEIMDKLSYEIDTSFIEGVYFSEFVIA
jgi:flagellar basal body-associated protein FliL